MVYVQLISKRLKITSKIQQQSTKKFQVITEKKQVIVKLNK